MIEVMIFLVGAVVVLLALFARQSTDRNEMPVVYFAPHVSQGSKASGLVLFAVLFLIFYIVVASGA